MWALLVPVAYLVGTFPSAAIVAGTGGVDIRAVGSGNPGASNVTRALGWRKGTLVFALDAAKGAICAGAGLIVSGRPGGYWLGAAAIVGHVFPVWQRFRGGKGVATGGGVIAVLSPLVFVGVVVGWFAVSRLTRTASLASILVVALTPAGVGMVTGEWWEVWATAGLCALLIARHAANIKRIATREEPALGSR